MLTITAITPVPALTDPASARPGGGEGDGFAPVLAALLTPGETASTITPPVATGPTDAPEQAFAPPPLRQAGTRLPPPGTPAPLAAASMPSAATLTPADGRQPAADDARLLAPDDAIDTLPGNGIDPAIPQRNHARAEEPYVPFTPTVVAPRLSQQASPADDRSDWFISAAVRTSSLQQPIEANDQLVPASEPDTDAMSACTPAGDPVASALALSTCSGDVSLTTPTPAPAQQPADRLPSGPTPTAYRPVDRASPARPIGGSDPSVAVPRSEVVAPSASSTARADLATPDTNSADATLQPFQLNVEPKRKVAVPLARDEALSAAPSPTPSAAATPTRDPTPDLAQRPAPVATAAPDPVARTVTRTTAQPGIAPSVQAKPPASALTAAPPPDVAIAPAATRAVQPSSDIQRAAVTLPAPSAQTPTPISPAAHVPVSPGPLVETPFPIATPAPITVADQPRPIPAPFAPSPAAGASVIATEPVAPTSPPVAAPATNGVSDAARPAFAPTGSPATVESRPTRTEPVAGIATAPVAAQPAAAIMPAFQAFGAALHRAAAAERRPALRDTPELLVAAPLLAPTQPLAPVTDPTPLDTTQARWPDAMIGRIEQLRDLVNEADTRIRLHPDALGTVDVALRREGDTVRVHFTAAEPATRTLLAEAQPRLQELAEAKGLKLGGAPVDAGNANTGANTGERRQPATPQPGTPARPRASTAAQPEAEADTRLA